MLSYRITFILFSSLFFYSCEESSVNNIPDLVDQNFSISGFSINYNNQENKISVYLEISDSENISFIQSYITSNGDIYNGEIISNQFLIQSSINDNTFLYEGFLDLSDEIYIYDIALVFEFNDSSQGIFLDTFSTAIKPEIISYTIPETFQLNATEWSLLPIDIEIQNLNGADNISSVTYQVQRFYNGCDIDQCIYDTYYDNTPDIDCNDPIEDAAYQSDSSWEFEYISSDSSNQNHSYHIDIPMRPLDGSSGSFGSNEFSAKDCGRTGITLFKFIVLDKDGLIDEEIDIVLETTE